MDDGLTVGLGLAFNHGGVCHEVSRRALRHRARSVHGSAHGALVGCFGGDAGGVVAMVVINGNHPANGDDGLLGSVQLACSLEEAEDVGHHCTDGLGRRRRAEQVFEHDVAVHLVGVVRGTERCRPQFQAEDLLHDLPAFRPAGDAEVPRTELERPAGDLDIERASTFLVEHHQQVLRPTDVATDAPGFAERPDAVHHAFVPAFGTDGLE